MSTPKEHIAGWEIVPQTIVSEGNTAFSHQIDRFKLKDGSDLEIHFRTVSSDEYWKVFEKKWTSLLSYRYLGRVNAGLEGNEDRAVTSASILLRTAN